MKPFLVERYASLILSGILLAGGFLLFFKLGERDFWTDEVFSVSVAKLDSLGDILDTMKKDVNPPLHQILLHGWVKLFGDSAFSVRALSATLAVLSLGLLYQIGTLLLDKRYGLWGAFFLAISPLHLLVSRMARWYALALFLGLLSVLMFVKIAPGAGAKPAPGTGESKTRPYWIGYIVSSTLLMYLSYIPISLILAQNLIVWLYHRRSATFIKRWILAQSCLALLYLPWVWVVVHQIYSRMDKSYEVDLSASLAGVAVTLIYPFFSFCLGETVLPWNLLITVPAFFLFFYLLRQGIRGLYRENKKALGLLLTFIGTPLGFYALTLLLYELPKSMVSSHLAFAIPFFYLLLSAGLLAGKDVTDRSLIQGKSQIFLAGALIFLMGYSVKNYYAGEEFHNPNFVVSWQDIIAELEKKVDKEDLVVSVDEISFDYYEKSFKVVSLEEDRLDQIIQRVHASSPRKIWVVWRDRGDRSAVKLAERFQNALTGYRIQNQHKYLKEDRRTLFWKSHLLGREVPEYKVMVSEYAAVERVKHDE